MRKLFSRSLLLVLQLSIKRFLETSKLLKYFLLIFLDMKIISKIGSLADIPSKNDVIDWINGVKRQYLIVYFNKILYCNIFKEAEGVLYQI